MLENRGFEGHGAADAQETSCGSRETATAVRSGDEGPPKTPKVHSSFRISPLVEAFGAFKGEKELIMKNMNFDGLMRLPKGEGDSERPFKLQFSFWLLMALDSTSGVLGFGKRGSIKLADADVGFVLGLQITGEDLDAHDASKLEQNKNIIRRNLMLGENDEIDFENIKKVLQRDISGSEELKDAFMTAVVIYAVSFFLAPKGRPPKINTDIFDSITDPKRILRLNWSAYVLKTLRECSSKVKSDVLAKKSSVCLDGCLLFLQIVYLDNLRIERFQPNECIIPRVADFTYEKLKILINMDKCRSRKKTGQPYGQMEIIHASESFYTWGQLHQDDIGSVEGSENSSCNSTLDSVLQYIDQENSENKKFIRKSTMDLADKLCFHSDRKFCDLKTYVTKCKLNKIFKEEPPQAISKQTKDGFSKGDNERTIVNERSAISGEMHDQDNTAKGTDNNKDNDGQPHGTKRRVRRQKIGIKKRLCPNTHVYSHASEGASIHQNVHLQPATNDALLHKEGST